MARRLDHQAGGCDVSKDMTWGDSLGWIGVCGLERRRGGYLGWAEGGEAGSGRAW